MNSFIISIELQRTLYHKTVENAATIEALQEIFPGKETSPGVVELEGGPIEITLQECELVELHTLLAALGTSVIRATHNGFAILVGED